MTADVAGLRLVSRDPTLMARFLDFAATRHAAENVGFYTEVKQAQNLTREDAVRKAVASIKAKYIGTQSKEEVNLSARSKKQITDALANRDSAFDFSCFDGALKEVEAQILVSIWQPFVYQLHDESSASSDVELPGSLVVSPAGRLVSPGRSRSFLTRGSIDVFSSSPSLSTRPTSSSSTRLRSRSRSAGSIDFDEIPPLGSTVAARSESLVRGLASLEDQLLAFVDTHELQDKVQFFCALQDYIKKKSSGSDALEKSLKVLDPYLRGPSRAPFSPELEGALSGDLTPGAATFDDDLETIHVWLRADLDETLYRPFQATLLESRLESEMPSFNECVDMAVRKRPGDLQDEMACAIRVESDDSGEV